MKLNFFSLLIHLNDALAAAPSSYCWVGKQSEPQIGLERLKHEGECPSKHSHPVRWAKAFRSGGAHHEPNIACFAWRDVHCGRVHRNRCSELQVREESAAALGAGAPQ